MPGLCGIKKSIFRWNSQPEASSHSEVCEMPAIAMTPDHWTLCIDAEAERLHTSMASSQRPLGTHLQLTSWVYYVAGSQNTHQGEPQASQ